MRVRVRKPFKDMRISALTYFLLFSWSLCLAQNIPKWSSAQLDNALQQGTFDLAKELILDNMTGADQLFLKYLQMDLGGERLLSVGLPALERAHLLADLFFQICEIDFELGIVSYWEKANTTQKKELLPILSDHYSAYWESRDMSRRMPKPVGFKRQLLKKCLVLAERYRSISFGKGELQAMLWASSLDAGKSLKTWQLAKSLNDEVGEVWGAYYYSIWGGEGQPEEAARHALEAARRLNLPKLQQMTLTRRAWQALNRDDYKTHIACFHQGLEVIRTIPVRQTLVGRAGINFYPGEAWYLNTLWRAYELKKMPGAKEMFEQGRALSHQYGGKIGELAYLIDAMQQFIRPGVFAEVTTQAESLAREIGDPGWLANFLRTKANGLEGTEDFTGAIAAVNEAAELYKKMGDRGNLAGCLSQRAYIQAQSGEIEGARTDYEAAIKLFDGLDLIEEAITARMDVSKSQRSQPKTALKYMNEALAAAEKIDNPGIICNVLIGRAAILSADSPSESVENLQRALVYSERHSKDIGIPEYLYTMRTLSQYLRRAGRYDEAIDIQKQRIDKARAEEDPNAEADSYYWLLTIYSFDLGEPTAASEYADEYTALMMRPGKKLNVNNYNRLASAYATIGQPARALDFWAKSLELAKQTPAGEDFQRMVHINVARTYIELGDYDAALSELEEEKALIDPTFAAYGKPIELQKAEWLNKMALVHVLSGNLERAQEESRQAIGLELGTAAGMGSADYYFYFTPGDALALAGKFDEAIDFHKRRRDRAREVISLGGERSALYRLGVTYLRAGNIAKAREALLAAVEIDRGRQDRQVGGLPESLLALSNLELEAGNLSKAEELLVEARNVSNPYDLDNVWQIERATARVLAGQGKSDLAETRFELALEALEGARERLRPEEFALRYGTDRLQIYDEYASSVACRAIETGSEADAEKALRVVERRRAQALWELMAMGWAMLQPEAVPEQLQRCREAETRLAAKQKILRDQFNLAPEKRNQALISRLEADMSRVKEDHSRLLTALAQGKFRFSSPSGLPTSLVSEIQKLLGEDCVLVEYLVTDELTFAFVISSYGLKLVRLPAGREKLQAEVQALLQPFYRFQSGELDLARLRFDPKKAHELYRNIFSPLKSSIGHASRIIVVPDDVLFYLPFEILVERSREEQKQGKVLFADCERVDFLVRRCKLSYLTAAADLLRGAQESGKLETTKLLLAMANPTARPDSEPGEQQNLMSQRLRSASFNIAFTPLPDSTEEIEQIRRYFPAEEVTVLTGESATETSYKELSPKSAIIHLATHAIAADDHPFYSTLILATDAKTQEDGFLQAFEILRSTLQARLVVLSGCETARGPLGRGEGLVGLVSAFLQAGARVVLATQWSIDESAAELMASFYKAMTGGKDMSTALREAKLQVMRRRLWLGKTEISLAHPFFWAPFVLIGQGD